MKETGRSIGQWALDTFGAAQSDLGTWARANREMAELARLLASTNPSPSDIADECADVVIVLARLSDHQGIDLFAAVDAKMKVNRARRWVLDGEGHGQHIEEPRP